MNWELVGQTTILSIVYIVALVMTWAVIETARQKKHERELALIEAQRPVIPAPPAQVEPGSIYLNGRIDPGTLTMPEGYDRTGDRGL